MSVDTATRGPGRPPIPIDQLEASALHRQADLAVAILRSLRAVGRGRFDSERRLRAWLTADGTPFTTSDIAPSLALLEANNLIIRPRVGLGHPRPGHLPTELDKPDILPNVRLARLVAEVIQASGGRRTQAEIAERLVEVDEEIPAAKLAETLQRLVDVDMLQVLQRQSETARYNPRQRWGSYGETDDLAADICRVLRSREELGFSDREQLRSWLAEAGVDVDSHLFDRALDHLRVIGRLQQPRAEQWQGPGERPTWVVDARPLTGDEWW